jgi:hypothetical protein
LYKTLTVWLLDSPVTQQLLNTVIKQILERSITRLLQVLADVTSKVQVDSAQPVEVTFPLCPELLGIQAMWYDGMRGRGAWRLLRGLELGRAGARVRRDGTRGQGGGRAVKQVKVMLGIHRGWNGLSFSLRGTLNLAKDVEGV